MAMGGDESGLRPGAEVTVGVDGLGADGRSGMAESWSGVTVGMAEILPP